ncbi:CHAD domain-containing protein [Agromyces mariniharenae]|uniref:CHAD domain-containing protein n=1 Tax=Agromyces mariniharenae TaxID=2604423 RepID=A0A5S4V1X1_9MICO|nr:CHAD domain-containing protein [Agromyces mariniharenae]TYL51191.1 CHAD domain-containing protein [Agromyces mariniharenae]
MGDAEDEREDAGGAASQASELAWMDAGETVLAAVRAIGARLEELEPAALDDEPDAVHQLRTHVRRLRSVLAAYAPLFDAGVVQAVRRSFRELGHELGTVRDIEVRVQVAEEALQLAIDEWGLDSDDIASMRARLVDDEVVAHRLAHARLVERQRMPRAAARREVLAAFLEDPARTPLADEPARDELGRLLGREAKRAVRRARRVDAASATDRLHDARKAGRRLRYAAEAVVEEPVALFGDRANALAEAGEAVHDVLGDHRDEVLFAEHVRRAGAHAAHDGEPMDAYERLAEAADLRAADRLDHLTKVVHDLEHAAKEWSSR